MSFDPKTQPREFLQALAAELGRHIAGVRAPDGAVVAVAKPPQAFDVLGSFLRGYASRDAAATKSMVLACVVYPTKEEAKTVLEAFPALLETLSTRAFELCGGEFERLGDDLFKAPDGRTLELHKPHNVGAIHARLKIANEKTIWNETREFVLGFVKSSRTDAIAILSEWPAMLPALRDRCYQHCGSDAEDLGKF